MHSENDTKFFTVLCDEAGSTGPNYLDPNQPIHVAGGWLVEDHHLCELETVVREFSAQRQGAELKGSVLLRRQSGQELALNLFRALGQRGRAIPTFTIAERRYSIAGKIVDTLFDPMVNERAQWLPSGDITQRLEVTQWFYALPDTYLREFAQVYRSPTQDALERFLRRAISAADLAGNLQIALTLGGNLRVIERLMELDFADTEEHPLGPLAALNGPFFGHLLKAVDFALDVKAPCRTRVVHDQTSTLGPVLEKVFHVLTALPKDRVDWVYDDGVVRRTGLRNISSLEFTDSKTSLGLQAADVLASAIARLTRAVVLDSPWSMAEEKVALLLLSGLLIPPYLFCGIYASEELKQKMTARLASAFAKHSRDRD